MGLLRQASRVTIRVVFARRLATVDEDMAECGCREIDPLTCVALSQEHLGESKWVHERLMLGQELGRTEQPMTGQMDVLVVDDDDSCEIFRHGGCLRQ